MDYWVACLNNTSGLPYFLLKSTPAFGGHVFRRCYSILAVSSVVPSCYLPQLHEDYSFTYLQLQNIMTYQHRPVILMYDWFTLTIAGFIICVQWKWDDLSQRNKPWCAFSGRTQSQGKQHLLNIFRIFIIHPVIHFQDFHNNTVLFNI